MFFLDNARPHVSAFTGWTLYELKYDLSSHQPHHSDISPTDFYHFSYLQLHHANAIFNSPHIVWNEVDLFLDLHLSNVWAEGFEELTKCKQKITNLSWWLLSPLKVLFLAENFCYNHINIFRILIGFSNKPASDIKSPKFKNL